MKNKKMFLSKAEFIMILVIFVLLTTITFILLRFYDENRIKDMQKYLYEQTGTIYDDRELLKTCLKIENRILSFKDLSIINNYPEIRNLPQFKNIILFSEIIIRQDEQNIQEANKLEQDFQQALKEHKESKK
jgi:hypothetical protein